jgi:hypothetical protein
LHEHVVRPIASTAGEGDRSVPWRIVAVPSRPADISNEILDYWAGVGTMEVAGEVDFGVMRVRERQPVFREMERHQRTAELIMALDGDLLVPLTVGGSAPRFDHLEVVKVIRGTGLLLGSGVWHAIPFSPSAPTACLIAFRRGTAADDLEVAPLPRSVRIATDELGWKGVA